MSKSVRYRTDTNSHLMKMEAFSRHIECRLAADHAMNAIARPNNLPSSRYVSRQEALRQSFAKSVEHLDHAEPDQIPNGFIQDYIAWGWLKRSYDGVQVTPCGNTVLNGLKEFKSAT